MFGGMSESDRQSRKSESERNVRRSPEWSRQVEKTLLISRRIRETRMRMEELLGQYRGCEAEMWLVEEEFKAELGELKRLRKQGLDR